MLVRGVKIGNNECGATCCEKEAMGDRCDDR
jgi:hypothetical protein